MAEYLIQDTTLTGIGDKIRSVTGTTVAMSPAEMESDLQNFNNDLRTIATEQDSLIEQIMTALEGKAAGGGSEVVTGTFAATANQTTITIPALVGKENFAIMFIGSFNQDNLASGHTVHSYKLADANMSNLYYYSGSGWYLDIAGKSTYDSTSGTITFAGTPVKKTIAGDYLYIGW